MTSGPMYGGPPYGRVPERAQLLASDADRDRAVDLLQQAFTEGRLTKEDYDTRAGQALAARSYADLDQVLADLPVPAYPVPAAPQPPAVPRMNGLAVASLACGAGQLFLGPLPTIPAIVLGHTARRQIRRTGETGSGVALAGLVLGWLGLAMILLVVLGAALFLLTAGGHPTFHMHPNPAGLPGG
jgi:Domain of unknown function (DUF1707)/Domain of unknown function (DUF4190)